MQYLPDYIPHSTYENAIVEVPGRLKFINLASPLISLTYRTSYHLTQLSRPLKLWDLLLAILLRYKNRSAYFHKCSSLYGPQPWHIGDCHAWMITISWLDQQSMKINFHFENDLTHILIYEYIFCSIIMAVPLHWLKTNSYHDANFVIIGDTTGCHKTQNDDFQWHQWWQSWHHDNYLLSACRTKWLIFCRQHLQMHFLERKFLHLDKNSTAKSLPIWQVNDGFRVMNLTPHRSKKFPCRDCCVILCIYQHQICH